MRPTNQKRAEIVAYVETAKTSHIRGLRNWGQRPIVFGYGKSQYTASHWRPVWKRTNCAAAATAKSVIASANRLMDVRHVWRRRSRIAEMSVPACPIPIHQTKLTMSMPHATGMLMPQIPTVRTRSFAIVTKRSWAARNEIAKPTYHHLGVFRRTTALILSVTVAGE